MNTNLTKILAYAELGIIVVLGSVLYFGTNSYLRIREQKVALQEELNTVTKLYDAAVRDNALLRVLSDEYTHRIEDTTKKDTEFMNDFYEAKDTARDWSDTPLPDVYIRMFEPGKADTHGADVQSTPGLDGQQDSGGGENQNKR